MNEYLIQFGGLLSFGLAVFHLLFGKIFKWDDDFKKIGVINGKILYTIHIFLVPFFFLFALISLKFSETLVNGTDLSRALLAFYSLFWITRGLWQFFYFDPSKISAPVSKKVLHYGLMAVSTLFAICYAAPLFKL